MTMPEHGRELRGAFHAALDAMDDRFVAAGLRVSEALPRLSDGFLQGDAWVMEVAEDLSTGVAVECERVEDEGFVLLAREAPVAADLRRLVALMRMTVDVSRSASLLRHACMTLRQVDPRFLEPAMRSQLTEMAGHSSDVFRAGIDAWRKRDALAVNEVDHLDESVDELQLVLLREAAEAEDPGMEMLVLGLLARYFERIADHGVEIARDAAYVATGERIRVGRHRAPEAATDPEQGGDGPPGATDGPWPEAGDRPPESGPADEPS